MNNAEIAPNGGKINRGRRDLADILSVRFYLELGCGQSFLGRVPLVKGRVSALGLRAVERSSEGWKKGAGASKRLGVSFISTSKEPGSHVNSIDRLIEYSLFVSVLNYYHGDVIYQGLCLDELVKPYDMYTNLRSAAGRSGCMQISLETAFYVSRELTNFCSVIAYCSSCKLHYYSSESQLVRNGCPFCRKVGLNDHLGLQS
jgi:hypothetical protein